MTIETEHGEMTVEAELRVPLAKAQLIRFEWTEPCDDLIPEDDGHRVDLSVSPRPRNARACYPAHWTAHRFERIGDILFVPAGEVSHVRGDRARSASIVCVLDAEATRAMFEDDLTWTDRRLEASLDIRSVSMRTPFLRLGEEVRHPGFASPLLTELIAGQIAVELFRYGAAIADRPTGRGLAPWRLRIIDERLREQLGTPTLAELARLCTLSVRQLTRGFRASRGCSIGEYVAESQLDQAKRLLATEQSIKSIAYSLGFASPANFSTAFRRATGETPGQFRRSQRRTRH
jgi:AraC family transcriptional regulator